MTSKFDLSKLLSAQERVRKAEQQAAKRPQPEDEERGILKSSSTTMIMVSDESRMPSLRHEVSQDRRTALDSASSTDCLLPMSAAAAGTILNSEDANMCDEQDEHGTSLTTTSKDPRYNFPTQEFVYQVPDAGRPRGDVMTESKYHDVHEYHMRVCIAINYKTSNPFRPDGSKNPPTKYKYRIYARPSVVLLKLLRERNIVPNAELRHAFIITEEAEPLFRYGDYDLPPESRIASVHGKNCMDLVGYALAMYRLLESQVLCVNLLCYGDGYVPFVSTESAKWSAHCHMPFPYAERTSLSTVMKQCAERVTDAYNAGIKAAKPLIYKRTNKSGKEELCRFADDKVFTKKRNFRLPFATKADKTATLVPTESVPLWNRPDSDLCVANTPFETLSAALICCRTSMEMWNANNVRNAKLLEAVRGKQNKAAPQLDVVTYQHDFRCLPVTGSATTYLKKVQYESKGGALPVLLAKYRKSNASTGKYEWLSSRELVDTLIDECIGWVFKLLYDDEWLVLKRNAQLHGGGQKRMVEGIMELCRKSPMHAQAFFVLLPHIYQPGKPLDQRLVGEPADLALDKVIESAEAIGSVFHSIHIADSDRTAAWKELWEYRTYIETTYSNTCTDEQRRLRSAYLCKLGDKASGIFSPQADAHLVDAKVDVRRCCSDVSSLDVLATELLIWSGQAIYAFQRESAAISANLPLLDVLCVTDDEFAQLIEKCAIYTCTRLGRTPDVPATALRVYAPGFSGEDPIDALANDLQKAITENEKLFSRGNRYWQWPRDEPTVAK